MIKNKQERGAALLAFLLMLIVAAFATWLFSLKPARKNLEQQIAADLKLGKQALLAYASAPQEWQSSAYSLRYSKVRLGELPCPDFNNDGQINPAQDYVGAHCKAYFGRLPWRTLRIASPKFGQIWYALSPEFANLSGSLAEVEPMINPSTLYHLKLDQNKVVALLIHSNMPLKNQSRIDKNTPADRHHYFEKINANQDFLNFMSAPRSADFNDVVLAINAHELFDLVAKNAAGVLVERLNLAYRQLGEYPDSASSPTQNCDGYGDFVPQNCSCQQGNFSLPQSTATGVDSWVFRNDWVKFFAYHKLAGNRVQLSARAAVADALVINLKNGERI